MGSICTRVTNGQRALGTEKKDEINIASSCVDPVHLVNWCLSLALVFFLVCFKVSFFVSLIFFCGNIKSFVRPISLFLEEKRVLCWPIQIWISHLSAMFEKTLFGRMTWQLCGSGFFCCCRHPEKKLGLWLGLCSSRWLFAVGHATNVSVKTEISKEKLSKLFSR